MDYNLEQNIFSCWNIVDELKTTVRMMDEHPGTAEEAIDKISNILIGVYELYDYKFSTLFDVYEQSLRQNRV